MEAEGTELVEAYDYLFKFIVIGEAGTVKENSAHTIGVEFSSRTLRIGDRNIKLQLWDTAGQERFRSVTRSYYRGAAGALLVYDITSALASSHLVLVLVGNKLDREEEREVEFVEGSRWAQENGLLFVEVSSLSGENVTTPFLLAARTVLSAIDAGTLDPDTAGTGRLVERAGGKDGEVLVWVIWWEREGAVASRVRFEYGADAMHCMISSPGHDQSPNAAIEIAEDAGQFDEELWDLKLKPLGFFATGRQIAARETPLGLYKGLGAVISGIVPKMAIRFASFELYKGWMVGSDGKVSPSGTFVAGLGAGASEAVAVVTPMEVVKIRLQAQQHSLADPLDIPRYRNAAHAAFTIVREEGISTLYRGVTLTALRQATNQGVNFTAYQQFKKWAIDYQPASTASGELPSYQTMVIGLISGAMGPFSNAPIDTIKTRIQKASKAEGETGFSRLVKVTTDLFRNEGVSAFYKGITPRVLRVAPGQAIVFTVYERVKKLIDEAKSSTLGVEYDE
ncbi:MAG: hypothetical protein TREMPRED_001725 [Tremellales sp. Tagirdzhanova-0007]|nr:MAG: hypothetical protein TREMPRED_001725 [Tremellales sp. Tagirdzhanova-0007]